MSRLSRSRISRACGAARMLRWPSARGPNSDGALHPADDAPGGELVRDPLDERRVLELFDGLIVLARRPREFLRVHGRAPERMIGHVAVRVRRSRSGLRRAPHPARSRHRPERGGTNTRSNPTSARMPRVGDAVQRDAAAEAQIRQPGLALERARDVHERVLEHPLHAGGAVGEASALLRSRDRSDRTAGAAARTARRTWTNRTGSQSSGTRSTPGRERRRRPAVRRMSLRTCSVEGRSPVGSEPHHLVLVLVHREAEIGGEGRVQHAQRMRESDLAQECRCRAAARVPFPTADRERRPFADAVGRQDRGAPRRRREEGRRRV